MSSSLLEYVTDVCLVGTISVMVCTNISSWMIIVVTKRCRTLKVIYIDQPIGTGFSFGTDTVNSTEAAAPFIWKAFQVLFESGEFSKFQSRECVAFYFHSTKHFAHSLLPFNRFVFATESYGGHYGPSFVTYFDQQNALIANGEITGELVVVSALLINK